MDDQSADLLRWELLNAYPPAESRIETTAFGNAVAAVSEYSQRTYEADAVVIWTRLLAVVPKEFQAVINDAKSIVDLWMNLSLIFGVMALVGFLKFIQISVAVSPFWRDGISLTDEPVFRLAADLMLLALGYICYRFAVSSIPDWGDAMKSAFDCYLPALATQMGLSISYGKNSPTKWTSWKPFDAWVLYGVNRKPRQASNRRVRARVNSATIRTREGPP